MSAATDVSVMLNLMPRSILEPDDEIEAWSTMGGGKTSTQSNGKFSLFQDYFGLSNLLSNVKISDDNPLLFSTQKNLALMKQRTRRQSWGSDGSDSTAVLSPTMENQYNFERSNNYDLNNNINNNNNNVEGMKPQPPPSMRLSKAARDHIISGAYQQQIENRNSEKFKQQPIVMPPPPPSPPHQQISPNPPPPPPPPVQNLPPNLPPPAPQTARNTPNPPSSPGLQVCVFCRNNGESESVYTSHVLKDTDGRTSCPILRAYTCPICKANGDNSHTIKYCPMNQNARMSGNMLSQQHQPPMGGFVPRNHPMPPHPPRSNNPYRPPFPSSNMGGNQPRFNPHQNGKMRP